MSEAPLILYQADRQMTLREMALEGRGVRLQCQRCCHVAERTALELLERHWRTIDAPLAAIMERTSCPACGKRSITLTTFRGETPFPVDEEFMSWGGRAAEEGRRQRLEDWLRAQPVAASDNVS